MNTLLIVGLRPWTYDQMCDHLLKHWTVHVNGVEIPLRELPDWVDISAITTGTDTAKKSQDDTFRLWVNSNECFFKLTGMTIVLTTNARNAIR